VIAFLASLTIFFYPSNQRYLRVFAFFLFISCIFEIAANYLAIIHVDNNLFASLTTTFDFTFYLYVLREIVYHPRAKRYLLVLLLSYPTVALLNILFVQRNGFHTMTYALGSFLIITFCIYYFWELFQRLNSVQLSRQPAFWVCSGLLFYYTCTFPIYGGTNLVKVLPALIIRNLLVIFTLLNILLYLSFTIAFLCRLKTRRSMS
jgi:hypothetical protein